MVTHRYVLKTGQPLAPGTGDTANDIVIVDNVTFNLHAECSGGGNGRVYTITYQATDPVGNSTVAITTVIV